jgi:hypothetical protein
MYEKLPSDPMAENSTNTETIATAEPTKDPSPEEIMLRAKLAQIHQAIEDDLVDPRASIEVDNDQFTIAG